MTSCQKFANSTCCPVRMGPFRCMDWLIIVVLLFVRKISASNRSSWIILTGDLAWCQWQFSEACTGHLKLQFGPSETAQKSNRLKISSTYGVYKLVLLFLVGKSGAISHNSKNHWLRFDWTKALSVQGHCQVNGPVIGPKIIEHRAWLAWGCRTFHSSRSAYSSWYPQSQPWMSHELQNGPSIVCICTEARGICWDCQVSVCFRTSIADFYGRIESTLLMGKVVLLLMQNVTTVGIVKTAGKWDIYNIKWCRICPYAVSKYGSQCIHHVRSTSIEITSMQTQTCENLATHSTYLSQWFLWSHKHQQDGTPHMFHFLWMTLR